MKRLLAAVLLSPTLALAHHGVAGVGAAALEGPGAPVESGSSAVLPGGKTLLYAKLDDARFKRGDGTDTEVNYNQYWMLGVGHGVTPWFSAYVFAPYNKKVDNSEPAGAATPKFDTKGWADLSVMGQVGFKYEPGQGFKLVPASESLDDQEDWHFTVSAGTSFPTGNPNLKNRLGDIDAGKSTSFGEHSYSLGFTATKQLTRDLTFNLEASTIRFRTHRYDPDTSNPAGQTVKFGTENRLNGSLSYRMIVNPDQRFRADGVIEAQYLTIGRDIENGVGAQATGGRILYLVPGVRLYKDNMSFAFGYKKAAWTNLNESSQQQGSEGKEKYRLIFSGSVLF
jgi:hypothetical protein